jgi:anthranilate phosphoribosyltransferase
MRFIRTFLTSSLLLLAAAESKKEMWDLSGFAHDMEEMMKNLKAADGESPAMMKELFEKLGEMAKGMGMPDLSGAAGAGKGFKIPERLFKGHIAKIAEELVKEFKPEDFGISPELLTSEDPARVFTYLQEVFTKKPEMLMTAAQKIAKRIQAKFQRGEIKREDIIREAEELMAEFSENEAFSSMFGSLSEMMKGNEKETGQDGSARLRETRDRMRKKQAEKAEKAAAAAAVAAGTSTGTARNVIVSAEATRLAAAAEAALLLEAVAESEASKQKKKAAASKSQKR